MSGTIAELGEAERSRPFSWLVRTGFLARGMTYGVVGALVLALAAGAGTAGAAPDQQGALTLVARAPLGFVAIVAVAAGLLAYAGWKLTQAVRGHGPEGGGGPRLTERIANGAAAAAYLLFCAVAVRILLGSGSESSNGAQRHATAGVLAWPGGVWLVGIAGAALVAASVYQAHYALTARFTRQAKTDQMKRAQLERYRNAGKVGLTARAIVLALIGYFLAESALTHRPSNGVSVDGALAQLHHQTLGPWLVGLVGVGLLVFAVFSLYEARYRRL